MTGTSRAWIIAVAIGGTSLSGQPHLPQHRHPRPMSRVRQFRSRHRPPVSYHQSDDDDDSTNDTDYDPHDDDDDDDEYERAVLRAKRLHNMVKCARYRAEHREKVAASKKKYRENNREFIAVYSQCYRDKRRKQQATGRQRYKAKYPERVAECDRRYRERNRTKLREKQRRYRERNRAKLREAQRRYREKNLVVEKKRTQEKLRALGPLTLTIPLTDYLKSIPVTQESVDTNGPPTDSHTLIDLDSGGVQVADSPDWENVSYLQELLKDMSPDDWQQVMNDVEEFDLEALLPPEDLVHDMSSDEGVDLLFDFMS